MDEAQADVPAGTSSSPLLLPRVRRRFTRNTRAPTARQLNESSQRGPIITSTTSLDSTAFMSAVTKSTPISIESTSMKTPVATGRSSRARGGDVKVSKPTSPLRTRKQVPIP